MGLFGLLAFLATTLTNRLLHAPCVRLREAAQSGDAPTIDAIAAIFGAGPER